MSTITSAADPSLDIPAGASVNVPADDGLTRTGTVKWFDPKKGFGFILNPHGQDVFVHFSSIEGDGFRVLKDGERVSYEQTQGAKGLLAKRVRREELKAGREQ